MNTEAVDLGRLDELDDPGCREFSVGDGDWPFHGFVVRQGDEVFAYRNSCSHAGHPLNWVADDFLTRDKRAIICASHGAIFAIDSGECIAGPGAGRALQKLATQVLNGRVLVEVPAGN